MLTGADGVQPLAGAGKVLKQLREVRADQYGIRTMLDIDSVPLKFEIVLEARIALEPPGADDRLCGVMTLTPLDMATSKLLANSDRWADDSAFSRDLIDLAMMNTSAKLLQAAIAKARAAYGDSIARDLTRSVAHLLDRKGRIKHCMQALQMTAPSALLRQRVGALT